MPFKEIVCPKCNGTGRTSEGMWVAYMGLSGGHKACPVCNGSGKVKKRMRGRPRKDEQG